MSKISIVIFPFSSLIILILGGGREDSMNSKQISLFLLPGDRDPCCAFRISTKALGTLLGSYSLGVGIVIQAVARAIVESQRCTLISVCYILSRPTHDPLRCEA